MSPRLLPLACAATLLCAAAASNLAAAEGRETGGAPPWTTSFTTQVRGADRAFVAFADQTWILIRPDEIASGLGDGQDVALTGKLRRLPGDRFGLYRIDNLVLASADEALAGRLDGDNVHLMGALTLANGARTLTVRHAAPAPSDASLLQQRLAGIGDTEWDRRLGVVSWCLDQARSAGNADYWTATADGLLARIVADMSTTAAERKDLALVVRALDLALNQMRDHGLAARVCSPGWIREHGGPQAEVIGRRMRGLGYALYKEEWLPRPQALEREFNDRFQAMNWKDGEGFYRLGRWVDENAEALPLARERSWRCYQAGFAADPQHPGIARELGIQARGRQDAAAGAAGIAPATDLIDPDASLRVPAPSGWRRGQPLGGSLVWSDPGSETAYLMVRTLRPPVDADAQWSVLDQEARNRTGFVEIAAGDTPADGRRTRSLTYLWTEAEQQRFAIVALVIVGDAAAIIEARGLPGDRERLEATLTGCAAGVARQAVEAAPVAP